MLPHQRLEVIHEVAAHQCPENHHVVDMNTLNEILNLLKSFSFNSLLFVKQKSLVRFEIHFIGIYLPLLCNIYFRSLKGVGCLTNVLVTKSKLLLQKIQYAIDLVSQGGQFPCLICRRYPVPKIIAILIIIKMIAAQTALPLD